MEENNKSFEQFLEEGVPSLESIEFDQHPSDKILISYVYDHLESPNQARISAHIATCSSCHEKIQNLRDEKEKVENQLIPLLSDPLQVGTKAREESSPLSRLKGSIDKLIQRVFSPHRQAIYAHIGAYVIVAALLFGVNKLLDWLLIPPSSPLGSTAKINRWWTNLYWILLPWGIFLMVYIFRIFFSSEDNEGKKEGG